MNTIFALILSTFPLASQAESNGRGDAVKRVVTYVENTRHVNCTLNRSENSRFVDGSVLRDDLYDCHGQGIRARLTLNVKTTTVSGQVFEEAVVSSFVGM